MKSVQESLVDRLRREKGKTLVDLDQAKAGRDHANSLLDELKRVEVLVEEGFDPLHAVYVYTQNFLSVLVEQAIELPELRHWVELYESLEEDYMPAGPPMSPLTRSYFLSWSGFDLPFGEHNETVTQCMIQLARELGTTEELLETMQVMQNSRMGFYIHEGTQGRFIQLRELSTNDQYWCHCGSGYRGSAGEIWYVRLLPPLVEGFDYHVAFTTPYVVRDVEESALLETINQVIPCMTERGYPSDYESFMKWGPALKYWNEYLMMAYSNYSHDVVYLTGYPSTDPGAEYGDEFDMNSYGKVHAALSGGQDTLASGESKPSTKKVISFTDKKKKRKQAKQARKRNRK